MHTQTPQKTIPAHSIACAQVNREQTLTVAAPTKLRAPVTKIVKPDDVLSRPLTDVGDKLPENRRAQMTAVERLRYVGWTDTQYSTLPDAAPSFYLLIQSQSSDTKPMQTIVTALPVWLSVCVKCACALQKQLNGSRSCLGGDPLGPKAHCIRCRSRSPMPWRCGYRQITLYMHTCSMLQLMIARTSKARVVKSSWLVTSRGKCQIASV